LFGGAPAAVTLFGGAPAPPRVDSTCLEGLTEVRQQGLADPAILARRGEP
jgi:hypothetical protein